MKFEIAFFAMSLLFVGCSSTGRVADVAKRNNVEKLFTHNLERAL